MLARLYDRAIFGLAVSGALSLLLTTLMIVVDVVLRNTGYHPLQSSSALSEYAMLFSTMAAAPWLVRENGHVAITAFVSMMPSRLRFANGMVTQALAVAVLALLSWRAAVIGLEKAANGTMDMRSITLPAWVLYAMLAVGLGLMAMEFLRLLLRREVYAGTAGAS
ncbi:TRAP transporter small permease [Antarcticimicrobium sediminis]|uniref:TRAP transporter small permease protein n=1 Tax=Antarcticimicrobium sediminis TaxID=2546227 RepID=A0A4R5ET49_9RHOB|nr:TRAP transporter small permease [Antarcticimicrobium sediminis]TDE37944.1 TRAP transporter small permease [Antarcticimicrobium sediminis]